MATKAVLVAKGATAAARDARRRDSTPPAMREHIELELLLPVAPDELYEAWLDDAEHGAFTGGRASIDPRVGGIFSAWDGYIEGETIELDPAGRIVQTWRTNDFEDDDPPSRLELLFEKAETGTRLRLRHSELPIGGTKKYREDWQRFYFAPMREYFGISS